MGRGQYKHTPDGHCDSMTESVQWADLVKIQTHCTVEKKDYFVQLTAAVKIYLELEIQSLPKCPLLTVFGKMYCLTKVNVLGNWEVSILFKNVWLFFFCFVRGYPKLTSYVPKMVV